MANSSIVNELKNAVAKEIIQDEAFYYAIDSPKISSVDDRDKLTDYNIFSYNKNPEKITDVTTFLTLQVHIPRLYGKHGTFVAPRLEIWIYSHVDHMDVDNIPKITANRNDYISILLDEKFNGRSSIGGSANENHNLHLYGTLKLVSNDEGVFSPKFLFRRMVFETIDINNSMCGGGN